MKLTGVSLITKDVVSLAGFYDKALNTKSEIDPVHTVVAVEGAGLFIYNETAAQRDMGLRFSESPGRFVLQFTVGDVDAEYARLRGMGVKFASEPVTRPWGARSMQFYDPDGNMVTFVSLPEADNAAGEEKP